MDNKQMYKEVMRLRAEQGSLRESVQIIEESIQRLGARAQELLKEIDKKEALICEVEGKDAGDLVDAAAAAVLKARSYLSYYEHLGANDTMVVARFDICIRRAYDKLDVFVPQDQFEWGLYNEDGALDAAKVLTGRTELAIEVINKVPRVARGDLFKKLQDICPLQF